MTRPSEARIDLRALRHNYRLARALHGGRALAVVKANAYGHGSVECARALEAEADGFAVAFFAEAQALREAGIAQPILVLEGVFDAAELAAARGLALWLVVHHAPQLALIEAAEADPAARAQPVGVWLKADSGMGRAGFPLAEMAGAHARLARCAGVSGITLMTHFARADEPASDATARQIAAFAEHTAHLPGPRSLANSAGVLGWPQARADWARPGIALYGADPMPPGGGPPGLQPVMTLSGRVFAERLLRPGDALGYGARFVAERPTRVGLVPIGYADGYPRTAPNGTPVAVDGRPARLIGRVSMDMLTVDLTDLPEAGIGSEVELWGAQVDINTVAQGAGTLSYELLCNVKRVPRVYIG